MNENTRKIFGIFLIIMFVSLLQAPIYADDALATVTTATSVVEKGIGFFKNGLNGLIGGNIGVSIALGAVTGVVSGVSTYNQLGETAKLQKKKDSVNISGTKGDYFDDKLVKDININYTQGGPNVTLTDSNILDLIYNPTNEITAENYPIDTSPTFRVAEITDKVKVNDLNGSLVDGQRRSMLFEDKQNTITRDTDFRFFAIKYPQANYHNPIEMSLGIDLVDSLIQTTSRVYELFLEKVDEKISDDLSKYTEEPLKKLQVFRLVFNSKTPDEYYIPGDQLDCTTPAGQILGTTGTEYLPRIEYDWTFSDNDNTITTLYGQELTRDSWCDIDNNGVYCDSTQFTIEILHKINKINELLPNCKNYISCPPLLIEQELVEKENNVGVTKLFAEKVSDDLLSIEYTISGNYNITLPDDEKLFRVKTTIETKSQNSFVWQEHETFYEDVDKEYIITGEPIEFSQNVDVSNILETNNIKVNVQLVDFIDEIEEYEQGYNSYDNNLVLEFKNQENICDIETKSTLLREYLIENDDCYNQLENLIKFKVNLMRDGFSSGFVDDFDELYRRIFLESPSWYNGIESDDDDYEPLYKYFTNKDLFGYSMATTSFGEDFVLPGPGVYDVEIRIDYDDNWKLFDNENPTGKIEVYLRKERNPEYDSVLYYLPIDGVLGHNNNKRQGYGVEFVGDVVEIDETTQLHGLPLQTTGYSASNTLKILHVKEEKDFAVMNNTQRGKILSVDMPSFTNNPTLSYAPSRPTPVALNIKNQENNAFAFYNLSLGAPEGQGSPAQPGMSLVPWSGYANCTDFTGIPSFEKFKDRLDIVSTRSQLSPITPNDPFTYGVEWKKEDITRVGNVWLNTIFYTPSNYKTGTGVSKLAMNAYADDADFYYVSSNSIDSGNKISLNNIYGADIQSIKQIFEMVADKKACVNTTSTLFEVYYNPKQISDKLNSLLVGNHITSGTNKCIGAPSE